MNKKLIILLSIVVFAVALLPLGVRAEEAAQQTAEQQAKERAGQQEQRLIEQLKQAQSQRAELLSKQKEAAQRLSEAVKKKLEEKQAAFQKSCQARQAAFKRHLENVASGLQKHVASLEAITARLEQFVKTKNLQVENYAALLAAVKTQQQLLETMREQGRQSVADFKCSLEKTEVQNGFSTYKDVAKQQLEAIKSYKTALKDLIKAIRKAAQAARIDKPAEQQTNGGTQQ